MKQLAWIKPVIATLLLVSASFVYASDAIHFDASSDAVAKASWDRMFDNASRDQQQQLLAAVIQINLVGVKSVDEVTSNPDLQNLSAVRIKDKIAGMTAAQIIDFANRVATVKIERPEK